MSSRISSSVRSRRSRDLVADDERAHDVGVGVGERDRALGSSWAFFAFS